MPIALLALALSAFGIGTTEFVIMGLLPNVADDLDVSITSAGLLVTGYALGVVVGAPVLTAVLGRLPRKKTILILSGIFLVGNLLCAVAPAYGILMVARFVTACAHGAFFGIASVVAAELVTKDKQASAIAMVFTGSTVANVLGVPLGTFLGQHFGWRSTFWAVTAIALIATIGIAVLVPNIRQDNPPSFRAEMRVLKRRQVLLALLITVFGYGGVFTLFTYITPLLTDVTGFAESTVSWLLVLFGTGLFVGNLVAGKAADRRLMPTVYVVLLALSAVLFAFSFTSHDKTAAAVSVLLLGATAFGTVPPLQMRILAKASDAPAVASAFNISAFNVANAGGSFIGGRVIDTGHSMTALGPVAAVISLIGLGIAAYSGWLDTHGKPSDRDIADQPAATADRAVEGAAPSPAEA
ncbi:MULTISPECIES: MFS transporter [Streptomyces]|uniref:MFS transporter n=2 Tax=Streptomyces TaxID=1883 RepID=A0ABW6YP77_9ACTN|nr:MULTISPECIES: MFS transporter [Streptomyces]MCL3996480.1 MFS transporter [Streptomyces lavenduligriseus]QIS71246.1 MFS transporter [Streptomyces sp. DSM 40868]WDM12435.1 MFS transporter [Streptomyces lavenduligriseus]